MKAQQFLKSPALLAGLEPTTLDAAKQIVEQLRLLVNEGTSLSQTQGREVQKYIDYFAEKPVNSGDNPGLAILHLATYINSCRYD